MSHATLERPVTDDIEIIDLDAVPTIVPSKTKQAAQPKRNKQEKRDRRHIRKAWDEHGPCTKVTYDPIPADVLREEIACCPPAMINTNDSPIAQPTIIDNPIAQPKSRREIRRARKASLIQKDKPRRTFKPKESSYSYIDSTKACKHGKNLTPAEREELMLVRMAADIQFEERYGVPYGLVIAS